MDPLIRMIYASRIAPNFGPADVHDILNTSRRNNPALGLTGLLVFADGYFLQALEGARSRINALYTRILRDPRHTDSVILHYHDIDRRLFGEWSMGYVLSTDKNRALFLAYSLEARFSPLELSAAAAESMLGELAEHARQIGAASATAG
ncbi:BLUF domain-containing protein [Thiomonas sp.]|uniref:BLUF domain-containing protein n=1 Tax=Thiomonas sp. TaxID=2047785 RepID=UPI00261D7162|nr:BLUF domain-containing protein [Thiomonas sp.]